MNQNFDDALFFEAVVYVLDEMSPSERASFEQRLIEEQGVREMVAGAVQLCQKVMQAQLQSPRPLGLDPAVHEKSRLRRPAGWGAAVAMAAGVLAMALIGPARKEKAPSVAVAEKDRAKELAVAWANLPALALATDDDAGVDELTTDPLSDEWLDYADVESDATGERQPSPAADWVFEALTAS
jgi:hypothetical protein